MLLKQNRVKREGSVLSISDPDEQAIVEEDATAEKKESTIEQRIREEEETTERFHAKRILWEEYEKRAQSGDWAEAEEILSKLQEKEF